MLDKNILNNEEHNLDDNIISIYEIFIILAKEIRLIIIFALVVSSCTFVKLKYFTGPIFVSTAKIISSSGSSSSLLGGMASQFGFQLPTTNQTNGINWVYPEIIKSRTMGNALINRKFDTQKYGNQKSLLQILTYGNKEPNQNINILIMAAVDKTQKMISVNEDKRTGICTITASAFEPKLASGLLHALIDELDKHQKAYNSKQLKKTKEFIKKRVFEVEKELSSSEIKLKNFRERNRRIENSPGLLLDRQRLEREVSVLTGVFTSLKQQFENSKIEEVRESDFVIILDEPETPILAEAPNKKRIFIIISFLGLFFAIALAFFKHFFTKIYSNNQKEIGEVLLIFLDNIKKLSFFKSN